MIEIVLASRNKNKAKEIKQILKGHSIKVLTVDNFPNMPEVKETALTFHGNAKKKAIKIAKFTGDLTIADDSGLEVEALGGLPGVRSARFAGPGCTYADNNKKLLSMLDRIPMHKRKARFICTIAVADKKGIVGTALGTCSGHIGFSVRGKYGFGYDPVFIVPKYKKTFAQLGPKIKNKISHRAKALRRAKKIIQTYLQKA
ncbi:MAG: XTP/dITP diphosphatase [Candidatus Omnitrophota bacterium]